MNHCIQKQSQGGAVTLIVAAILLVAVLGMSFFMANAVVSEKQMVANEFRSKQALMAGQSGIDHGIAYIRVGSDQVAPTGVDQWLASVAVPVGDGSYVASMADVSASGNRRVVQIVSRGFSDDSGVQRIVTQVVGIDPWLDSPPGVPLVARGSVDVTGSLDVTNNNENITIWTGAHTDTGGSSNTYISIDGEDDQLSTSRNTKGPDVIDEDANLADLTPDDLLSNFVGGTWAELAAMATMTTLPAAGDAANNLIYINGDLTGGDKITGGVWGDENNPVMLVVNGSLEMNGGEFYGLIVARNVEGAGNADIHGGIIATENMDFGAGTFSVTYNENVLNILGGLGEVVPINSSWKDWGN